MSTADSLRALEHTLRMERVQIWLDDAYAFAEEADERTDETGQLGSVADNEWIWTESNRLVKVAYDLLRDIWLAGLERDPP